jgi:hypothetical protein
MKAMLHFHTPMYGGDEAENLVEYGLDYRAMDNP